MSNSDAERAAHITARGGIISALINVLGPPILVLEGSIVTLLVSPTIADWSPNEFLPWLLKEELYHTDEFPPEQHSYKEISAKLNANVSYVREVNEIIESLSNSKGKICFIANLRGDFVDNVWLGDLEVVGITPEAERCNKRPDGTHRNRCAHVYTIEEYTQDNRFNRNVPYDAIAVKECQELFYPSP